MLGGWLGGSGDKLAEVESGCQQIGNEGQGGRWDGITDRRWEKVHGKRRSSVRVEERTWCWNVGRRVGEGRRSTTGCTGKQCRKQKNTDKCTESARFYLWPGVEYDLEGQRHGQRAAMSHMQRCRKIKRLQGPKNNIICFQSIVNQKLGLIWICSQSG